MDKALIVKTIAFIRGEIFSEAELKAPEIPDPMVMTAKIANIKTVIRLFCNVTDNRTKARQANINPAEVAIPPSFKI